VINTLILVFSIEFFAFLVLTILTFNPHNKFSFFDYGLSSLIFGRSYNTSRYNEKNLSGETAAQALKLDEVKVAKGKINHDMQGELKFFSVLACLSMLEVGLFIALPWLSLPLWMSSLITYSIPCCLIYLSVMVYGIINDHWATKMNLVYFHAGHQEHQNNLIPSNDQKTVAVAWGIYATGGMALIFSILLGGSAAACIAIFGAQGWLATSITLCYAWFCLGKALWDADCKAKAYVVGKGKIRTDDIFYDSIKNAQVRNANGNESKAFARWHANGIRNSHGYGLAGVGIVALILIWVLSVVSSVVVPIPLNVMTYWGPAVTGGLMALFVAVSLIYMVWNRNIVNLDQDCACAFFENDAGYSQNPSVIYKKDKAVVKVNFLEVEAKENLFTYNVSAAQTK
jgi:hypothetical protein